MANLHRIYLVQHAAQETSRPVPRFPAATEADAMQWVRQKVNLAHEPLTSAWSVVEWPVGGETPTRVVWFGRGQDTRFF